LRAECQHAWRASRSPPTRDKRRASLILTPCWLTVSFLEGLSTSQFESSESRQIILRPGTPKEKRLVGQTYLANYGLPQFFFHVTTAYAILRHNGIAIGKRDYMGGF
jgi:hypothetical protein